MYVWFALALDFTQAPQVKPNPNPRVPLAAVVQFTADAKVKTQLTVSDGKHRWTLDYDRDPAQGLPVVGMRPNRAHTIGVTIRDSSGKTRKHPPLQFTTPPLPQEAGEFPPVKVTSTPGVKREPGITVASVRRQAMATGPDPRSTRYGMLLAIDEAGEPVWYYRSDARISDFERGPNGNIFLCTLDFEILEIDLLGNTVASWYAARRPIPPSKTATPVDTATFHHEIDVLPNGNILVLGSEVRTLPDYYTSETDAKAPRRSQKVMGDEVIEFQRDGKVVWRWNAFDALDPKRIGYETFSGYWVRRGFPGVLDWSHANNLLYDRRDDSILVSFRYQSAIVKIDRATRQLRWILGKPDQWSEQQQKLLFAAEPGTQWFHHQHAPFPTARGTMMVFDNGNYATMPFAPPKPPRETYTRAVEYRLDEKSKTVRQLWESEPGPRDDSVVSIAMGNVEQLPKTGNVLVSYGALMSPEERRTAASWDVAGGGVWTRLREYTYQKPARLAWEAVIRDPEGKMGWQLFCATRWSKW